jgi:hypothetical protein
MVTELAEGALIIAPLSSGSYVHGLCIRLRGAARARKAIKRTCCSVNNKTYRGVVCVALGTAVGLVVIDPPFLSQGSEHRTTEQALLGLLVALA